MFNLEDYEDDYVFVGNDNNSMEEQAPPPFYQKVSNNTDEEWNKAKSDHESEILSQED